MKTARRVLFWAHLVAGTTAGLVILVMSATGVLLAFEKQLVALAERGYRSTPPAGGVSPLPPQALLERLLAARSDAVPVAVTLRSDPLAPATVSLQGGRVVHLDAYDGRVLGEGSAVRGLVRTLEGAHRWLALGGPWRDRARNVTGAANILFLFLVLSGPFLWLPLRAGSPRGWSRASVRAIAWFRAGLAGRARDFNRHNTVGVWCAIPLAVIVVTAIPMSYSWGAGLLLRLAGEEPARRPPPSSASPGERRPGKPDPSRWQDIDPLVERARRHTGDWRTLSFRLPASPSAPLVVSLDAGTGGQPQKRGQLTFDRATLSVSRWEPFEAAGPGRRLRSWFRFLHTGEALGLPGQLLAAVASAGAAVLAWTGLALAFRRFFRKASPAEAPAAATVPDPGTARATR